MHTLTSNKYKTYQYRGIYTEIDTKNKIFLLVRRLQLLFYFQYAHDHEFFIFLFPINY